MHNSIATHGEIEMRVDPDERVGISLLHKNTATAYPETPNY
jgi:hypothetical protein